MTPVRRIHFGTVADPDVGQHPTSGPESSFLWESNMLALAQGTWRPTAVLNWIRPLPETAPAMGVPLDSFVSWYRAAPV